MDNDPIHKEFIAFIKALSSHLFSRLKIAGLNFELIKDFIVDLLLARRGAHTSLFIHLSILGMAIAVLITGGVLSSTSVISGSYPGIPANPLVASSTEGTAQIEVISSTITPLTVISEKPRDKIVEYEVVEGNTISSIAQEWGVSEESILWANDLTQNGKIKPGQKLDILPVSGVAHDVQSGDTIYSIAKKYRANAQAILDFPLFGPRKYSCGRFG